LRSRFLAGTLGLLLALTWVRLEAPDAALLAAALARLQDTRFVVSDGDDIQSPIHDDSTDNPKNAAREND